jgi:hypothetical protein
MPRVAAVVDASASVCVTRRSTSRAASTSAMGASAPAAGARAVRGGWITQRRTPTVREPHRATPERQDALGGQDFIYSQRSGVEEELFKGSVLGVDADVATGEHRESGLRTFSNVGDGFYVPERFMQRVAVHVAKNILNDSGGIPVPTPLILGIWGGKGCGKTFNVELACKAMGLTPIVTSAGELEDRVAGEPGALLRRRYLRAARYTRETGKLCCLIINDLDAGIGKFKDDLGTVNSQITHGTLMNICDNPTMVSEGTVWRSDFKNKNARVPIIVTGNDFSKLYAPLTRDGRMDLWYWTPSTAEMVDMLHALVKDDGLKKSCCETLVAAFPNQPLDFFGATRARVYDEAIREMIFNVGLADLNDALVGEEKQRVTLDTVDISLDALLRCGRELAQEQQNVNDIQLAREYMRWQEPEELANAQAVERSRQDRPPPTMDIDVETQQLLDDARAKMLQASERAAAEAPPAPVEEEEPEIEALPWRVENIGEAQRLYESGVRVLDVRPVKDFNRETLKGALSTPAAVRTGGLSDAVDTPDIEAMLAAIAADKKFADKSSPIVVFHGAEHSAAYHVDTLHALSKVFDDVIEVDGGLPFYLKHFTPSGKRRPRYVGYGSENEETFWTASN